MGTSVDLLNNIERLSFNGGELKDYECLVATLANLRHSELKEVVQKCDIMKLFTAMDLHQERVMEVALRLAATLFSVVPLVKLVEQHQAEVLHALNSNRVELIYFVLNKLVDGLHETNLSVNCLPDQILHEILSLTVHAELRISLASTKFLTTMAVELPEGLEKLLSMLTPTTLQTLCSKAEHILRVSEMTVVLVAKLPDKFKLIEESGILQPILDGLMDQDPLNNLNFLQLAKTLVTISPAHEWLERLGVLENLLTRLSTMESNIFRNLLVPGYLIFFGILARRHPSQWLGDNNSGRTLVKILANSTLDPEATISMAALESVSHVAGTVDGTKALSIYLAPSGPLFSVLNKLGKLLHDAPNLITVQALDCLTDLVRQPTLIPDLNQALEQAQIKFDWVARIGQLSDADRQMEMSVAAKYRSAAAVLKRLTSQATNPYPDTRLASLKAIQAFATQPWGVKLLLDQAGCMEYLLNRRTEIGLVEVTQLMQAKYDIVEGIMRTVETYRDCEEASMSVSLQPEQIACLRLYIKEGIWGTQPSQSAVAMEPG